MSISNTLSERGNRYGDFSDHARLAQALQDTMRNFSKPCQPITETFSDFHPWENLSAIQKQALTVIADKIARILSGDPDYADNWHDIQGYAKLVEDRLPIAEPTPEPLSKHDGSLHIADEEVAKAIQILAEEEKKRAIPAKVHDTHKWPDFTPKQDDESSAQYVGSGVGDPFAVDWSEAPAGAVVHAFNSDGRGRWWSTSGLHKIETGSGYGHFAVPLGSQERPFEKDGYFWIESGLLLSLERTHKWSESLRHRPEVAASYGFGIPASLKDQAN